MYSNIIIPNQQKLDTAKEAMRQGGSDKLHILADFDRTLTFAPALISILHDENYLTLDYQSKARDLFDKYHPIEKDPNILKREKKEAMKTWWTEHFNLLIKSGLNKRDVAKAMQSDKIQLRDGFKNFFKILKQNNIPLVIMSSSGLGGESIELFLRRVGQWSDNIYLAANVYQWDENDYAIGVKEPIIHSMNKDETIVANFPFFNKIKQRKNVILLGDSLSDVGMIEGFEYDNLIKIGFLNADVEANLEYYKKIYDAIVLNDGGMRFVNEMLKFIILKN